MGEDFDYWGGAARERPALVQFEDTLAAIRKIDWASVSDGIVRKLGRRARLQRSLDIPVRQRTALDAANCALARLIESGFCK